MPEAKPIYGILYFLLRSVYYFSSYFLRKVTFLKRPAGRKIYFPPGYEENRFFVTRVFWRGFYFWASFYSLKKITVGVRMRSSFKHKIAYTRYPLVISKNVDIFEFSKRGCSLRLLLICWKKLEWRVRMRSSFKHIIAYISRTVRYIEKRLKFFEFSKGSCTLRLLFIDWIKLPISQEPLKISENG